MTNLKKKKIKVTVRMLIISRFCFSYLNYMYLLGSNFYCGIDKNVWKALHYTIAASQVSIYWAPIISLFLHYYITTKTYSSKPWFCFWSVNYRLPVDARNSVSWVSTLHSTLLVLCSTNTLESAFSEDPSKVTYNQATTTKVGKELHKGKEKL